MKLKSVSIALSATAMLMAPVAAQAGTAPSASVGKVSNLAGSGARQSTAIKKKQNIEPAIAVVALIGAGLATYGIVEAVDGGGSSGD